MRDCLKTAVARLSEIATGATLNEAAAGRHHGLHKRLTQEKQQTSDDGQNMEL